MRGEVSVGDGALGALAGGGPHPGQNKPSWSVGRWLGVGAGALALGLAVSAGQALAGADPGDTTQSTATVGAASVGQASDRSASPFGQDSSGTAAPVPESPRPTSGSPPVRPRPTKVAASANPAGHPDRAARRVEAVARAATSARAIPDRRSPDAPTAAMFPEPVPARSVIEPMVPFGPQITADSLQRVTRYPDIAYGPAPKEKLDVYAPPDAAGAPMILMIHGGAWAFGDKRNVGLVRSKVDHFVPEGVVFIAANYPMLPSQAPDGQADSVAAAISYVQTHAMDWGGDPDNLVIMGHSAGGHLVALVSAHSDRYPDLRPWRGTVVLDSAALDLVARMEDHPPWLFRRAFGSDPAYWESVSPLLALHTATEPLLLVCASRRTDSCPQAQVFATAASSFGTEVHVLPQDLTHRQINVTLGRPGGYTDAVDAFLRGVWSLGDSNS